MELEEKIVACIGHSGIFMLLYVTAVLMIIIVSTAVSGMRKNDFCVERYALDHIVRGQNRDVYLLIFILLIKIY